jgi:hypothetical protein
MNVIRKGQVKRLDRSDVTGQAKFVASLFGVAAYSNALEELSRLKLILATLAPAYSPCGRGGAWRALDNSADFIDATLS